MTDDALRHELQQLIAEVGARLEADQASPNSTLVGTSLAFWRRLGYVLKRLADALDGQAVPAGGWTYAGPTSRVCGLCGRRQLRRYQDGRTIWIEADK